MKTRNLNNKKKKEKKKKFVFRVNKLMRACNSTVTVLKRQS